MTFFRSGCSMSILNKLINVFDDFDRHEFDDQMAIEVHIMKEHIFNILGIFANFINVEIYFLMFLINGIYRISRCIRRLSDKMRYKIISVFGVFRHVR